MTINNLNVANTRKKLATYFAKTSAIEQIFNVPHKHRLKLEQATPYVYAFRCVLCEDALHIDKFLVRLAIKNPGMLVIENVNLWWSRHQDYLGN